MGSEGLAGRRFPVGGGQVGDILRARDWRDSPLGPTEHWPEPLRCVVETCLNSPLLGTVLWGPELIMLYNDAYIPSLADRHPAAFGRPVSEVWGDAWEQVSPPFLKAMQTGAGFARRSVRLDILRHGKLEVTWWDFSAAPIRGADGTILGLLNQGVEMTDQVKALEAARAAEERYALALSAGGGIGAWDWDVQADRLVADASLARMYAVDPGEAAQGAPIAAFLRGVHPQDLPRLSEAIASSLRTGEAFAEDYRVSGGTAGMRWIAARGRPHLDPHGRATRFAGVSFDITDRHMAVAALRSSEMLGRQILDSAVDYGIIATDLDGRITRLNTGAARILGWTEAEMLGQTADRFFTPEDLAAGRVAQEMATARNEGSGNDERWHLRKDGTRFWAQGKMTPLLNEAGELAGYVKVMRDQTRERLRTQRLRLLASASEDLLGADTPDDVLNAVLDASAGLIDFDQAYSYSVTPDGAHLRLTHSSGVSLEAQAKLQYTSFEQPLCGIIAHTRRPLVLAGIMASTEPRYEPGRAAGLNAFAGYPVLAGDKLFGVLSFGSFSITAFDDETLSYFATLARYVSVVRERADRQAALQELNATLERRVEERSQELMVAEEHLRQSQKMEAVGQLTGGLAHDFNNLLTGIAGSLELLQTRVAQGRLADVDRFVNAAQGAARRAAALTHRLLAFSRRQTLDPKVTDVNRLVIGMMDLVRRTVGPEIEIEVAATDGVWNSLVDPSQLENALLNLCINARDAMPDGGKLVIETANRGLDARSAREPGQFVVLCVSDNGTGMPPEVADRAFEPFFTTKPLGQGTGLGLSMIYGFVRQSGGQVRISSAPGQGTMVCLYLPRHLGEAEEADAPGGLSDAPRASAGETVLVVDDEPTVRMLVIEILQDLGYAALEAADGASGIKLLQSEARIDLLVTDVGLPGGMNGRQLADAARVARPLLKVLFITGYAETAVASHGRLEAGMHVLTKPFALEMLASRIKELLAV